MYPAVTSKGDVVPALRNAAAGWPVATPCLTATWVQSTDGLQIVYGSGGAAGSGHRAAWIERLNAQGRTVDLTDVATLLHTIAGVGPETRVLTDRG